MSVSMQQSLIYFWWPRIIELEFFMNYVVDRMWEDAIEIYFSIVFRHFNVEEHTVGSRDSSVCIAMGCTAGVRSRARTEFWSRPVLGSTQPLIQWVPWAPSPGVKRPGREAEYSPASDAEVKNTFIYTSTPAYVFMAKCWTSYSQRRLYLFSCDTCYAHLNMWLPSLFSCSYS
jgi:hypothetical protein